MSDAGWILVVDDDDDIRDVIVMLLQLRGFSAMAASDGIEALERIRGHGRPAVMFVDLRMPRMNGPDLVRAVRADPALASIPIVVLSGDASAGDVATTMGATLLRKPIELDDLLGCVRGAMAGGA